MWSPRDLLGDDHYPSLPFFLNGIICFRILALCGLAKVKLWLHLPPCVLLKDLTYYQGNTPVPADLLPHWAPAEGKAPACYWNQAVAAIICEVHLSLKAKVGVFCSHAWRKTDRPVSGSLGRRDPHPAGALCLMPCKEIFCSFGRSLGIAAFEGVRGSEGDVSSLPWDLGMRVRIRPKHLLRHPAILFPLVLLGSDAAWPKLVSAFREGSSQAPEQQIGLR